MSVFYYFEYSFLFLLWLVQLLNWVLEFFKATLAYILLIQGVLSVPFYHFCISQLWTFASNSLHLNVCTWICQSGGFPSNLEPPHLQVQGIRRIWEIFSLGPSLANDCLYLRQRELGFPISVPIKFGNLAFILKFSCRIKLYPTLCVTLPEPYTCFDFSPFLALLPRLPCYSPWNFSLITCTYPHVRVCFWRQYKVYVAFLPQQIATYRSSRLIKPKTVRYSTLSSSL